MQTHNFQTVWRNPRGKELVLVLLTVVACLALASCVGRPSDTQVQAVVVSPNDMTKLKQIQQAEAITPAAVKDNPHYQILDGVAVENLPAYRLGSGDVVEIVYHIQYSRDISTYKFDVQDKININFPFQPQFSSSAVIRTDGRISLPLVGEVMAESLTPPQLATILNRLYSKFIIDPRITVSLEEFNVKVEELKRAITTAPRGQSKIAPISPDGRISLPIIGNLQAAGLTVRQLEKIVNERYGAYIRNLHVTLILNEIHHMKFYILGEVNRPGVYEVPDRPSLLEAIARAGGYTNAACLSDVVVLRSDGLQKPIIFKVNLEKTLGQGVLYPGLDVKPADVIYVPKSRLDQANDVITKVFSRGLYGIMPFSSSFTMSYDVTKYINGK